MTGPLAPEGVAYDTTSWSIGATYAVLIMLTIVFGGMSIIEGPRLYEVASLLGVVVLWVVQLCYVCSTLVLTPLGEIRGERAIGSVETHITKVHSGRVTRSRPPLLVLRGERTLAIAAPIDGYDDLIRRLQLAGVSLGDEATRQTDLLRGKPLPRNLRRG